MTELPSCIAVVLAAGKGTRMKSTKAKVLHPVFFKPMFHHVLDAVAASGIKKSAVIVGHQREAVTASLHGYNRDLVTPVEQEEQNGTGHAVLCAEQACMEAKTHDVLILCGDTPLIKAQTLESMLAMHQDRAATVTLLTTEVENPFGYGRILMDSEGQVTGIVEEKDASEPQRQIKEINTGIYIVERTFLFTALKQVGTNNRSGEVYLTDIVAIAHDQGRPVVRTICSDPEEVLGVNSRVELAQANAAMQMRHNRAVMLSGVTMYQPESITISPQAHIDQDVTIHPMVQILGTSIVEAEAVLEQGCIIHNSKIVQGESLPPYTLRSDTIPAEERKDTEKD